MSKAPGPMFRPLFSLFLLLLVANPAQAWEGKVLAVHDGDSIRVRDSKGRNRAVRFYGVDAPEMETDEWPEQAHAAASRDRLRELLPRGQSVDIREDQERRSYGRVVATVVLPDGTEVNRLLLEEGMAWYTSRYCRKPFCAEWKRDAEQARRKRLGLWANEDAVPPWEWKFGR